MLIVSYLGALPRGTDRTRKPPGAVLCAFPTSSHRDPEKDTALEQRGGRGTFRQALWVSQGQDHAPGVAASSPRNGFYPLNSLATERALPGLKTLPRRRAHRCPPGARQAVHAWRP